MKKNMTKKKKKVKKFTAQNRNKQLLFIGVILTIIMGVLCYRILYNQLGDWGNFLRIQGARQRHIALRNAALHNSPASRGEILDRNMQPLAQSRPVFDVFIDVSMMHDAYNRNAAGRQEMHDVRYALNEHFGMSFVDFSRHFATDDNGNLLRNNHHLIVAREVEPSVAHYLTNRFTHVHSTGQTQRFYPEPFFAPQVIGFIRGGAMWGLEHYYDEALSGTPGRRFTAHGEVDEIPVRHGYTLVTTIDADIQRIAQDMANQTFNEMDATHIGVLIMDPHTGAVIAMAQAPTFSIADPMNPEFVTDRLLRDRWDYLSEAEQVYEMQRLWRNFHTTYTYEPGSIFKPFVIAAALEEGVISTNQQFFCTHVKYIWGPEYLTCHSFHGSLTLRQAIYRSCNVAMFYIVNMMGRDMFYRYRGYFGFGERTGIDLVGETCVSHSSVMYSRGRLGPMELGTSSMGQGFNATTMQSITAFSALINGGNMMEPFLVSHILDSYGNIIEENTPTVTRRIISPQISDWMRRHMAYVVSADGGTARFGRIPGHTMGGKTGTAQQGVRADGIHTLTYLAYTPIENPEFVALIVAHRVCREQYGGAGRELSPRMARIFEEIIAVRGMLPSDGPYATEQWQEHTIAETMPNYTDWRLTDAVRDLSSRSNGGYQVVGTGTIVSHTIPEAGRPMPQGNPVFFHMTPDTTVYGQMVTVPTLEGLTIGQARNILREFGLPMFILDSLIDQTAIILNEPRTTNPLTTEEREVFGSDAPEDQAIPESDVIYRQYPSPGTELERGTHVKVRAR